MTSGPDVLTAFGQERAGAIARDRAERITAELSVWRHRAARALAWLQLGVGLSIVAVWIVAGMGGETLTDAIVNTAVYVVAFLAFGLVRMRVENPDPAEVRARL